VVQLGRWAAASIAAAVLLVGFGAGLVVGHQTASLASPVATRSNLPTPTPTLSPSPSPTLTPVPSAAPTTVPPTPPTPTVGINTTALTDQLQAEMATWTGQPGTYPQLVQQALSQGDGALAWLQTQLTTNPTYTKNAQTPWLQTGLNYQQWQNWKIAHQTLAWQQYGHNITEQEWVQGYLAGSWGP